MHDYPLLNLFWTMLVFFLWVMWLATGGQTAATLGGAVNCLTSCMSPPCPLGYFDTNERL